MLNDADAELEEIQALVRTKLSRDLNKTVFHHFAKETHILVFSIITYKIVFHDPNTYQEAIL